MFHWSLKCGRIFGVERANIFHMGSKYMMMITTIISIMVFPQVGPKAHLCSELCFSVAWAELWALTPPTPNSSLSSQLSCLENLTNLENTSACHPKMIFWCELLKFQNLVKHQNSPFGHFHLFPTPRCHSTLMSLQFKVHSVLQSGTGSDYLLGKWLTFMMSRSSIVITLWSLIDFWWMLKIRLIQITFAFDWKITLRKCPKITILVHRNS